MPVLEYVSDNCDHSGVGGRWKAVTLRVSVKPRQLASLLVSLGIRLVKDWHCSRRHGDPTELCSVPEEEQDRQRYVT